LKILDKYLGGRFVVTFFFIIGLLVLISIVIDLTENLDDMLESSAPAKPIIIYYLNFIPWILSILAPLFVFISVIFFTSRLTNNSEIIATISGGVSFYRLLVPFMVAATFLGTLFFFSNHYLLPKSNKQKIDFEQEWLGDAAKIGNNVNNIHMKLDENQILYVRSYSRSANIGYEAHLETFDGNSVIEKWKARSIEWIDSLQKWELKGVDTRKITDNNEVLTSEREKILELDLVPQDFAYMDNIDIVKNVRETLTTPELNRQIVRERKKGSSLVQYFLIEKNKRTATPVSILIFTVMGVSISSRKTRGGTGIHLAFGLLLSAIFVVLLNFSETISETSEIPAMLSIWLPNILFAAITIILVLRAQK